MPQGHFGFNFPMLLRPGNILKTLWGTKHDRGLLANALLGASSSFIENKTKQVHWAGVV